MVDRVRQRGDRRAAIAPGLGLGEDGVELPPLVAGYATPRILLDFSIITLRVVPAD